MCLLLLSPPFPTAACQCSMHKGCAIKPKASNALRGFRHWSKNLKRERLQAGSLKARLICSLLTATLTRAALWRVRWLRARLTSRCLASMTLSTTGMNLSRPMAARNSTGICCRTTPWAKLSTWQRHVLRLQQLAGRLGSAWLFGGSAALLEFGCGSAIPLLPPTDVWFSWHRWRKRSVVA